MKTAREHKIKVAEGNAMHVRINEDMLARAAYYKRSDLDPRTWTDGEKRSDKGKTVFDVTKQKILAGVTIIYDMLCMGGRLAFMLVPDDLDQGSQKPAVSVTGRINIVVLAEVVS